MIWKKERPKFSRAETVSTVKFQVPIQVWFWDKNDDPTNAMSICLNQRKVGADPLRAELTMILGQLPTWASAQLEQIHLRRPRKDDTIYLYSGNLGLYSFNARTKRGTFQLRNVDRSTEEAPVIDWRAEGSMSMAGAKIGKMTFVLPRPTTLPSLDGSASRPEDEKLISFEGSITGTVINLVKSTGKPSDQAAAQFSSFF